jgi:hypothetical protein
LVDGGAMSCISNSLADFPTPPKASSARIKGFNENHNDDDDDDDAEPATCDLLKKKVSCCGCVRGNNMSLAQKTANCCVWFLWFSLVFFSFCVVMIHVGATKQGDETQEMLPGVCEEVPLGRSHNLFLGECVRCQTTDVLCTKENCAFAFLQLTMINRVGDFEVGPNAVTSAACTEAFCEAGQFVPCSGATRRMMNATGAIARPGAQCCRIVEVVWEDMCPEDELKGRVNESRKCNRQRCVLLQKIGIWRGEKSKLWPILNHRCFF